VGRGAKADPAQVEGLVGLPEPIWQELFEEVDRLKMVYQKLKEASPEERSALEEEALRSLTHLWAHTRVMWEELALSDVEEEA
jgi:hypothetical protein